ncbi:Lipase 2 [Grifola frondosa]|uniref:Carboxylic ester hydrolase n=1 Tax=Grifola frondosa TaxID=5627 RepID=A0A1C7MK07_GRIFR|nr:Lipase 2 [Grifola frondosa]
MRLSRLGFISFLISACVSAPQVQLGQTILIGRSIAYPNLAEQEFFGGIPFAEAPVRSLRFSPPVLKSSLNVSSFDASNFGAPCPQLGSPANISEDCLTINVLRPAGLSVGSALPVMAFVYGGGFSGGTRPHTMQLSWLGKVLHEEGAEAASRGALNLGLKDQLTAMQWIHDKIATFGGDPAKVTIFGESAGAISIALLFLNSGLEHLARAAILESGSQATTPAFPAERRELTLGLLNAYVAATKESHEVFPFVPTIDGPGGVVPDLPSNLLAAGKFSRLPFIAGTNQDEGTAFISTSVSNVQDIRDFVVGESFPSSNGQASAQFNTVVDLLLEFYPDDAALGSPFGTGNNTFGLSSQYKRLAAIASDNLFHCPQKSLDTGCEQIWSKTFVYLFEDPQAVPADQPFLGVTHGSELPYVYGATAMSGLAPANALSVAMMDYWISFAVDLDPNDGRGSLRPTWKQYTPVNEVLLQLNGENTTHIQDTFRSAQFSFINGVPSVLGH